MKIYTGKAYERTFAHAPGNVVEGRLLFTSGITARRSDGVLVSGGMRSQAEQVVANLKDIFEKAGTACDQIVKLTIYVTDIDEYMLIKDACAELLSNNPSSTLIQVPRLASTAMKVEIEAVATID